MRRRSRGGIIALGASAARDLIDSGRENVSAVVHSAVVHDEFVHILVDTEWCLVISLVRFPPNADDRAATCDCCEVRRRVKGVGSGLLSESNRQQHDAGNPDEHGPDHHATEGVPAFALSATRSRHSRAIVHDGRARLISQTDATRIRVVRDDA